MNALKARDHSHLAAGEAFVERRGVDALNARRAVGVAGANRDLPALPGAGRNAHLLKHEGEQTGRHLLAGRHHRVVLAGVVELGAVVDPPDEFVGLAGHGGDHDGHLMASLHLAAHVRRHVADALNVGDGRAAEFHHQSGHVPRSLRRENPWGFGGMERRGEVAARRPCKGRV